MFGRVGFTPFFEALQDYNDSLTSKFTNSWFKGKVIVGSLHCIVTPQLIVEATRLKCEGMKIVKKSSRNYQNFIDKFFEDVEKLEHFQNGYDRLKLPPLYALVSLHIMRYFTLEGGYMTVHGYHFPLLNYVRHNERVNLSFYLFSSLQPNERAL